MEIFSCEHDDTVLFGCSKKEPPKIVPFRCPPRVPTVHIAGTLQPTSPARLLTPFTCRGGTSFFDERGTEFHIQANVKQEIEDHHLEGGFRPLSPTTIPLRFSAFA